MSSTQPTPTSATASTFLTYPFTHLILGGGTAGLVVATRLSENPFLVIGILEAGPLALDDPAINVPGRKGETLSGRYDWGFETTAQVGLRGRRLVWNRGRVVGGSSALNFMLWMRGSRGDYAGWERLGNRGWGWEGLEPFFKKSEHFHPPTKEYQARHHAYYDPNAHGTDGPIHIIYPPEQGVAQQYWHATLNDLGAETNRNPASGEVVGCWTALAGVDPASQTRCYSASAYYAPAAHRKNLVLLAEATVREIVLEEEKGEEGKGWAAKGVRFVHEGKEHIVRVAGEVILSAGTVQSPQLLELSGIGNPEFLQAAGIDVKVENPNVGENLQEHMLTMMVYEIDPSISTPEALRADATLAKAADDEYLATQSGPRTTVAYSAAYLPFSHYATPSELSALASQLPNTTTTTSSTPASQRTQILTERFSSVPDQNLGQIEFLFDLGNSSPFFPSDSDPTKRYATMMTMLQYPFSVGCIHIPPSSFPSPSHSPTTSSSAPLIDPKYFSSPHGDIDFQCLVSAQRFAHKICSTRPLADVVGRRVFPPEVALARESREEDFSTFVRDTLLTDWHPVGTCAMMGGRAGKAAGVVDERLRVYGVRGLRVIDASIMPLQIGAHLQATVYAIAEKGASMVLEDWGLEGGWDGGVGGEERGGEGLRVGEGEGGCR